MLEGGWVGILGSGSKLRQRLPLRRGTRKAQVSACELNNAHPSFITHSLHSIIIVFEIVFEILCL